jgi:membrane-bound lytic murein transglycosylase D
VFVNGRIGRIGSERAPLLAIEPHAAGAVSTTVAAASIATAGTPTLDAALAASAGAASDPQGASTSRQHTVTRGDNAWTLARRYGIRVADLLQRNNLSAGSTLKPGLVLQIDPALPAIQSMPE